jgi:hypothetical protein
MGSVKKWRVCQRRRARNVPGRHVAVSEDVPPSTRLEQLGVAFDIVKTVGS